MSPQPQAHPRWSQPPLQHCEARRDQRPMKPRCTQVGAMPGRRRQRKLALATETQTPQPLAQALPPHEPPARTRLPYVHSLLARIQTPYHPPAPTQRRRPRTTTPQPEDLCLRHATPFRRPADLDLRSTIGGGFGWHAAKSAKQNFDSWAAWSGPTKTTPLWPPQPPQPLPQQCKQFLIGSVQTRSDCFRETVSYAESMAY